MRDKVAFKKLFILNIVLTQEMCKTQEMCNKAVDAFLATLKFVYDLFVRVR